MFGCDHVLQVVHFIAKLCRGDTLYITVLEGMIMSKTKKSRLADNAILAIALVVTAAVVVGVARDWYGHWRDAETASHGGVARHPHPVRRW